jgi:hypothetical protein
MKFSNKQRATLDRLDRYIQRSKLRCNDAGFRRGLLMRGTKRPESPVSGEAAYFLVTDKGYRIEPEDTTDWERFKMLMIGHRRLAITVAMLKEDLKKGMLAHEEIEDDMLPLVQS